MFCDIALQYDPDTRRCDLVFENGDLRIDRTPATPMLLSLGLDRRAEPDDVLPDSLTEGTISSRFDPRRGWVGDALDTQGRRAGSRLWLLDREKNDAAQKDQTRLRALGYASQALAWLQDDRGVTVSVAAEWSRRERLLLTCRVEQTTVVLPVAGTSA